MRPIGEQDFGANMQGGERYYSISDYLKNTFGGKTIKLSLDAGFTCPNRDGTLGTGGCAFCSSSGSGEFASPVSESCETEISAASITRQIQLLSDKWPEAKHIAYFQNHTNTYAPVDTLRSYFYQALADSRIQGIAIATRPDCLGEDVLQLLEEIHQDHFLWVELGLQTIHPRTSEMMGIGYGLEVFDNAIRELHRRGIRMVVHMILGLPGETTDQMFETARYIARIHPFGVKIHMLNLVRGSRLYEMMPDYVPFQSLEEYCELVVDILEVLPPDVTVHRLTADTQRGLLVAPEWSYRKRTILNRINRRLKERNTRQGASYSPASEDSSSSESAN